MVEIGEEDMLFDEGVVGGLRRGLGFVYDFFYRYLFMDEDK